MRAIYVTTLNGPTALEIAELEPPVLSPEFPTQCLIDVETVGISFPDLLLSQGKYQLKPELPFVPGVDFAGTVAATNPDSGFEVGQRVAGCAPYGAAAQQILASSDNAFPLPDELSFEQGAALPMNYLTVDFALRVRAELQAGETVLIHGAAGGVGTAAIQVAKGMGARTIAIVSSSTKEQIARQAGADEVIRTDGFLAAVKELTDGAGVDVIVDVVGDAEGETIFLDSLRSLAPLGRHLVIGFAAGQIPQVRVNRLLLNNIDVRGVGWGEYAMARPGYMAQQWQHLLPMMRDGTIDPVIGRVGPMEEFGDALVEMDARGTLGKSVIKLR